MSLPDVSFSLVLECFFLSPNRVVYFTWDRIEPLRLVACRHLPCCLCLGTSRDPDAQEARTHQVLFVEADALSMFTLPLF